MPHVPEQVLETARVPRVPMAQRSQARWMEPEYGAARLVVD